MNHTSDLEQDTVEEIEIACGSRDVKLIGTEEEDVLVEAEPEMKQYVRNKILHLDENTPAHAAAGILFAYEEERHVTVHVPDGVHRIVAHTAAGTVEMKGISADTVTIITASGDVRGDTSARHLKIQTASGDGNLQLDGVKQVQYSGVSGDVKLKGYGFETAEIRTVSGDVTDETEQPYVSLQVDTVSGDVKIRKAAVDLSCRTLNGEIRCDADRIQGQNRTDVHTLTGDLSVYF